MKTSKIKRFFDLQERKTKLAEELSRKVTRLCSKGIIAIHRHKSARSLLRAARINLRRLEKISTPMSPGCLTLAQQEFGEFFMLSSILERGKIPEPEEIGIPYYPYLMALADVGGELRRALLDSLRKGDLQKAEKLLHHMEQIFEFLSCFDHPDKIIPGLRRKRDVLARILEKSRGDLTLATLKR
jgi:translin